MPVFFDRFRNLCQCRLIACFLCSAVTQAMLYCISVLLQAIPVDDLVAQKSRIVEDVRNFLSSKFHSALIQCCFRRLVNFISRF